MADGKHIAFLGGIPPALGGGGIEVQMQRTAAALRARGHRVSTVAELGENDSFDLLHAFGSSPEVWQYLQHWRRNRAPLVVSPVIVVSPGRGEQVLVAGSKIAMFANVSRMHRDVVVAADRVVALTAYEKHVVGRLGADASVVTVIDNGADRISPAPGEPADTRPHALLLGTISDRKRQAEIVRKLGGEIRFVVVGGFQGGDAARDEFANLVNSTGSTWLGELSDPAEVARAVNDAAVLVQFSESEVQSLAVMESLAAHTPVVASNIPSHRELAERWPGWVTPVDSLDAAGARIKGLLASPPPGPPPEPPTWDDVAAKLTDLYAHTLQNASPRASS